MYIVTLVGSRRDERSLRLLRHVIITASVRKLSYDVIDIILQDAHSSGYGFHFNVFL